MARTFNRTALKWQGTRLLLGNRALAEIIRDTVYPSMWRFRLLPNGELSDWVNLTRAKDAAATHVLADLNGKETAQGGVVVRSGEGVARYSGQP